MLACPSCAHENSDGAKFCEECGTPLGAPARPVAEERKIVTSLFCDLVGFTAISESADPEDVDQMLAAYFSMARKEIEAFGGTVEKFIGDAVVGVFGVPAAHEDDPERAVRAGLRIAEAADELTSVEGAPLKLRIGINTGEVLVRLGVTPGSGEGFLRGDAINTASRLQSIAPEMGVAVGSGTYDATNAIFEYEELEPAVLKGKAEPVRVFWAKEPRARLGADLMRRHDSPFVGREIDLAILKGLFDKTVAARSPHLITVIGEPGLGKSRIVAELGTYVDAKPDLITWRQGRCLPYGEGITFWALGEILKAHAGILESDPPSAAITKLDRVLPEGGEREWFRQRLLPLLGIEATSPAEREELFTAWRRFFEHVAEQDPTILVLEDLHWADQAMLAFIEHLADRAEGVPLLIIGTARPELFEHQPDYARGLRNSTPVTLDPLSDQEMVRLVSGLLDSSVIPEEIRTPILERSGGNPLYAEEFVRLLKDKLLLVGDRSGWELAEGTEIPLPDSVQAMIAARLDTLSSERKAMLADAAVIGKIFWAGAVAAMGGYPEGEVTEVMRELSRKELVRSTRHSSMEGEAEYSFWHVLARDVTYAQLPRASRASRHVAAAEWIESKAPDRLEDLADVLAYHYSSALELARVTGSTEQAAELEAPARRFLTLAGERALGLDTAAALDAFERALALTPEGHPERPHALARFGEAALQSGRLQDAASALEGAISAFHEQGGTLAAARAMGVLGVTWEGLNDPRRGDQVTEALALLEPLPPGPDLVDALARAGYEAAIGGRPEEALELTERALTVAADVGLPRPARALGFRGEARCALGDAGGLQDGAEAVRIAIDAGEGRVAAVCYNNLGVSRWGFEGPRAAIETFEEGRAFAEARGLHSAALSIRTSELPALLGVGELEQVLASAETLGKRAEDASDEFNLIEIRGVQAMALTLQGLAREASAFLVGPADAARRSGRGDNLTVALGAMAIAEAMLGDSHAAEVLAELEATPDLGMTDQIAPYLPALVRAALQIDELLVAERLVSHVTPRYPYAEHALSAVAAALAEARDEIETAVVAYGDAAERWEAFAVVPEQGFALLGQGRCLLERSRSEAVEVLQRARDIFTRCGMHPALEEADALLAKAITLGS